MIGRAQLVPLTDSWSLWPAAALRGAGLPFERLARLAVPDVLEMPPGEQRNAAIKSAMAEASRVIAADDTFREAIVWQNPSIAATWLDSFAADPAAPPNAYRVRVVARYAQRYCSKNESIGFFGPVGWVRFTPGRAATQLSGDGGIRRRAVYLETWAIAALADAWRQDERIFPHLPVRLDPATWFANGVVAMPRRPPETCSPMAAALLGAIDGRRTCGDVLAEVTGLGQEDEARAEFGRLQDRGAVRIGFTVPFHQHPERLLRQQVSAIRDAHVRAELLSVIDEIGSARDAVARARGPRAVQTALEKLSDQFARAVGRPAAAVRPARYGRTVAYLDCRRDTDGQIGDDLLDALRAPLGILLASARWLASEVGKAIEERLIERYRWLRSRRDVVTISDLQFASGDVLSPGGLVAREVLEDFQMRWAEIIGDRSADEIRLSTARSRPLADALFPAAGPRWAAARQHSPDLLVGRGPDGRLRWVVGELHVALNTLESRVFITQCDDPDELLTLAGNSMSGGRVLPLYPVESAEASSRAYPPTALDRPDLCRYWSYASDQGHPQARSVPGAGIVVTERDGTLIGVAGTGESSWEAPVLEFFGDFLTAVAVNLFQIRQAGPHLGRVILDDVVIARESWSIPLGDIPLPRRNNPDRGHEPIRAWAARLGLPRHVFFRVPGERKPVYLDFSAPLLVDDLVKYVRDALGEAGAERSTLTVVEMLPGPEDLWLADTSGASYTSEIRAVAVDKAEPGQAFYPLSSSDGRKRSG